MKIATKDFVAAVGLAAAVTERRNTIPILSTVLVTPDEAGIICRATDLDIQLDVRLSHQPTDNPLSHCLLEPQRLVKVLRAVQADDIGIEPPAVDDNRGCDMKLSAGAEFSAKHSVLPEGEFPVMHASEPGFTASLPRSAVDLLLQVAGAASSEETRYYLNGVYFHHVDRWTYRFAATDGHRLYYADVELPDASGDAPVDHGGSKRGGGIIIPRKAIGLLSQLRSRTAQEPIQLSLRRLNPSNEPVDWTANPQATLARFEFLAAGDRQVTLTSKLIDGTFPDYTRVIPNEDACPNRITVKTADLRRVVAALSDGNVEKSKALRLRLNRYSIDVGARYVDSGFDGAFTVPASVNTPGLEIGFNGRYLISVLNALACEDVTFMLGDPSAPARVVDPAGAAMQAVLMPMRV
jgi:DNA polymerase-3 subunit beta